ncbi:MAG: hypothetical protein ACJAR4_002121, partial [Psychroserpens sp.]
MKKTIKHIIYLFFFGIILHSCSITKYIPEGERLYIGAKIEIKADSSVQNVDDLKTELETVLRPTPNSEFLGMRLGLYCYYKNQK